MISGWMPILLASFYLQVGLSVVFNKVYVEYGNNIGEHVISQLEGHLSKVQVTVLGLDQFPTSERSGNDTRSLVLLLGQSPRTDAIIPFHYLESLPAESFVVRSQYEDTSSGHVFTLAADGRPLSEVLGKNSTLDRVNIHYGAILGT